MASALPLSLIGVPFLGERRGGASSWGGTEQVSGTVSAKTLVSDSPHPKAVAVPSRTTSVQGRNWAAPAVERLPGGVFYAPPAMPTYLPSSPGSCGQKWQAGQRSGPARHQS